MFNRFDKPLRHLLLVPLYLIGLLSILATSVDPGPSAAPKVALNAAGDGMAVWESGDHALMAEPFDAFGFAGSVQVAVGKNPAVAAGAGDVFVAWEDDLDAGISVDRYNGVVWAGAVPLSAGGVGFAYPDVATNIAGDALVVWNQAPTYNAPARVWGIRYTDGVGWEGSATLLSDPALDWAGRARVAMDDAGNGIAVWHQHKTSPTGIADIWVAMYDGTNWSAPALLETDDLDSALFPHIAMNGATGEAMVVWQQGDGVYANQYDGATWGGAALLNDPGLGTPFYADVAINANGDAVAVWTVDGLVYASFYDAVLVTWQGTPDVIGNAGTSFAYSSRVGLDDAGNAVAVWVQGDGVGVYTNDYAPGGGWLVNPVPLGSGSRPDMAMNGAGEGVIAWDSGGGVVQATLF